MDYQPIVKQLSQLLMNDWDNRSSTVNPLVPLALLDCHTGKLDKMPAQQNAERLKIIESLGIGTEKTKREELRPMLS